MKILLLGKNGQIGWELQRSLAFLGDLVALAAEGDGLCGNLANLAGVAQTIRTVRPSVIVNAAAYTSVDKAESEPEVAYLVNAQAPARIAKEAKECGALFVHYSTDYVFDGSSDKPWLETDLANPLNVYGLSKLAGERAIQSSGCKHLIFRSSWIYAARGNNFAKTMLHLGKERDCLKIVNDQVGAPTGADLVADITAHAIRLSLQRPEVNGLYHLAAEGETTWYNYARFVLDVARQSGANIKVAPDAVMPIPARDFPTPAKRPQNSRLNKSKLTSTFEVCLPDWKIGVRRMLSEILES